MEGIGEEVGQEAALGVLDAGMSEIRRRVLPLPTLPTMASTPDCWNSGMNGSQPIQWSPKNIIRFLAVGMDDVGHFLHQTGNLTALECLKILVLLARHAVLVVVVALVDDELRAEFVADFLLKLLQNIGRNGRRVAVPVHVLLAAQLVKHQREQVEEGRKAHNVDIGVAFEILAQAAHCVGVGLGLAHIERIWCSTSFQSLMTELYMCTGSQIRYAKKLTVYSW